ncbi:MAG: bifunctional nicotinamidase/pyrazinamidase [Saprospiraceae bacterium]
MKKKDVLLVIGMQVDMLPGGALEVPGGEELIPIINDLMGEFEVVIAANFCLPPGHLSFAGNHPWRKPGQVVSVNGVDVELEIMYCIQDSFGAAFAPGLAVDRISHILEMAAEEDAIPHSAFFDTGNPRSTGLKEYLSSMPVKKLYLCGMPFDPIVVNTAIDAKKLGYEVEVLKSACRMRQPQRLNEMLNMLEANGIAVN